MCFSKWQLQVFHLKSCFVDITVIDNAQSTFQFHPPIKILGSHQTSQRTFCHSYMGIPILESFSYL